MPPATSLSLGVATPADADALARLVNAAYRGASTSWTHEGGIVRGPRISTEEIRERLGAPGSAMLLATRDDGSVVGCVHVEARDDAGYIGLLSVDPASQSAGTGSALMRHAEDHVKGTLGREHTIVWVIDARPELRAWYERLGYAATGETSPFPADEALVAGMSFVVLRKALAPDR